MIDLDLQDAVPIEVAADACPDEDEEGRYELDGLTRAQ